MKTECFIKCKSSRLWERESETKKPAEKQV